MATKVAQRRLQKEYLAMQKSPPPFIWACPEENNILNWHFIIRGPPDSPYDGGEYHGLIWFPSEYPFKPPDIKMFTPSGRFEVGHKICMSMTSYHPSTWNAAWSVSTILTGLLSFMLSDEITAGAVRSTDAEKRALAKTSHGFNLSSKKFRDTFPAYAGPTMSDLPDMGKGPAPSTSVPASKPTARTSDTTHIISDPSSIAPTPSGTPAPPEPNANANDANDKDQDKLATAPVNPVVDRQVQPEGNAGWVSWQLVAVVAVLAVLGRLSVYAGRT